MRNKKIIKHLELFSGIGGFRMALETLAKDRNFRTKCIGFSDIDKYAIQTYKANYQTNGELEMGDIENFTQKIFNIKKIPDFDLLTGGFPCQPFSMMGRQLGIKDQRGNLLYSVVKILEIKKPKYFLLENVRNLFNHDKFKTYRAFKKKLEESGYLVKEDIFNTSDFGLPQHRRRLYIFGQRTDISNNLLEFSSESIIKHSLLVKSKYINKYKTVLDGLLEKNVMEKQYFLSEKIKPTILSNGSKNFQSKSEINQLIARPLTATMVKLHRACQDNYYSQEFLSSKDSKKYLEKKISKEEEAKHKIRKITPIEALLLQGFSKDFYKKAVAAGVGNHQLYRQAGNAVSINTVYYILDYLMYNKIINF